MREFIDWSSWILQKNAEADMEKADVVGLLGAKSKEQAVAKLKQLRETAPKGPAGTTGGHLKSAMDKLHRMKATMEAGKRARTATESPKEGIISTNKAPIGKVKGIATLKPTAPHSVPPKK